MVDFAANLMHDVLMSAFLSPTDLTPPAPLSNFAATPLVERGEPKRACFLAPPLHEALRSNAELERGLGGEVGRGVRSIGRAGLLLLFAHAMTFAQGCHIDIGDPSCAEGVNFYDKDDACPYGPPGGPRVHESACPDIPQEADPLNCTASWSDVYALFTGPVGNCALNGCHGSAPGGRGVLLPLENPNAFYDELKAYRGSQGYPYINESDPAHSWILCNLAGLPGGGAPMPPPSGFGEADFALIQNWAVCGLRRVAPDAGP